MNTIDAKNIFLVDYLQSVGITPCKKQGNNVWYFSPFRNESEPSFKVNLARNLCTTSG
jgi:DNA primase